MSHHNHPHHHSSRHYGQPRPGGSGSSAAPPISHTPHSGNPSSAHSRDSSRQTPRSMDTRPVWKAPECPDLTRYITLDSTTTVAEGGFSYIYRGTVKYSTGKVQVAVKVIRANGVTADPVYINTLQRRLRRESGVWFTFRHKNIIPLLGLARDPALSNVVSALVFPWCDNGTVLKFVQNYPQTPRIPLIKGIASGLQYIHSLNAVHGDIKSDNVLMSDDYRPLLTDFGCSKILDVRGFTTDLKFSPKYTAPELLELPIGDEGEGKSGQERRGTPSTKETDVWAFGMVGAEIAGGLEVFASVRVHQLPPLILKGGRPRKTDFFNISGEADAVWPLLEMCWNAAPEGRPTMEGILGSLS